MRAHLVQLDIAWEDRRANHARAAALLDGAPIAPGDLVVLPEMFDTGFSFALDRTADADALTFAFLRDQARARGITIQGARTVLGPDARGRNRATIVGPDGSVLAEYDKIHPFSFGRETECFSPGDRAVTYRWASGADSLLVCPAICYDLRFPELFRAGVRAGAELFALGANWPAARAPHFRALLAARAIENQAFVLGVNRVGNDPNHAYAGGSVAIDPQGVELATCDDRERVLTVEIDPATLRAWRAAFPALRDMRPI